MPRVRRSARNRVGAGGAREEEEEVPPRSGSEAESEAAGPESPDPVAASSCAAINVHITHSEALAGLENVPDAHGGLYTDPLCPPTPGCYRLYGWMLPPGVPAAPCALVRGVFLSPPLGDLLGSACLIQMDRRHTEVQLDSAGLVGHLIVRCMQWVLPVPISLSRGHFALRYEVPKFLPTRRGGHLCMAMLTITAA